MFKNYGISVTGSMRVASFNVNSIRARLNIVLSWLEKNFPDILCIQETKTPDAGFPVKAFKDKRYHAVFCGEKSYNGVAILSRESPKHVKIGFDEYTSEGTRLITVTIHGIPIVNTYIPQGYHPLSQRFRYKLDWFQRLYDYFNKQFRPDSPLLWTGDFNVAPDPIDVYDPKHLLGQIGFHPDEHAALQRLKEWGFVDVFRMHQPDPKQFTFWDYRVRNAVSLNIGWRVDHIWATSPLAKKSTGAWIDRTPRLADKPSDHTVIVAEFKI
jgi:exodeoxyribonuclease-3